MNLALYQPEIPANTGTLIRLGACLDIPIHIIEPCGFLWTDKYLKRAGMDYMDKILVKRHESFGAFKKDPTLKRVILLDVNAEVNYLDFSFQKGDTLLLGQESEGVPDSIFEECPLKVCIMMKTGARSLNVALSAAMVLGEALRQTRPGGERI